MKNISFNIPVSFFKEKKQFIAYSPVLDLSTSGKTFEQAKQNFQEAVDIFFEETVKHGTFEDVLSDLGWEKINKQWNPPVEVAHSSELIGVPSMVAC